MSNPQFRELNGTQFLIAGRKFVDFKTPGDLKVVRERNIRNIFIIYLGDTIEADFSPEKMEAERRLIEHEGIKVIMLPKEPKNIRPFEIFSRTVEKIPLSEKVLVMCYHGLHNSAAYAAYHLLKEGRGFNEVYRMLRGANISDGSIATIKNILQGAGIHPERFAEQWALKYNQRRKLAGRPNLEKLKAALKKIGEAGGHRPNPPRHS